MYCGRHSVESDRFPSLVGARCSELTIVKVPKRGDETLGSDGNTRMLEESTMPYHQRTTIIHRRDSFFLCGDTCVELRQRRKPGRGLTYKKMKIWIHMKTRFIRKPLTHHEGSDTHGHKHVYS